MDVNTDIDTVMQNCSIVIVASVEPVQPWSQTRLDVLEADLKDRVMTLDKHGGMNRREDRKRERGS